MTNFSFIKCLFSFMKITGEKHYYPFLIFVFPKKIQILAFLNNKAKRKASLFKQCYPDKSFILFFMKIWCCTETACKWTRPLFTNETENFPQKKSIKNKVLQKKGKKRGVALLLCTILMFRAERERLNK